MGNSLRLATRTTPLAMWQAQWVADRLPDAKLLGVSTLGDRQTEVAVSSFGGRGVFVREVQQALIEGRADLAVHSAKDLPAANVPGLIIAAVPFRADPRDALVGCTLEELAPGARVATGAPRRRAQLAWLRSDLVFSELRGSIETRLGKLPRGGAIVMALAALQRLELTEQISEILDPSVMLPQGGQGALALECRQDDLATIEVLSTLNHEPSHRCFQAERSFLRALGAGCDTPAGALGHVLANGDINLEVLLASGDGRVLFRRSSSGTEPISLGAELAIEVLDRCGGRSLLASPSEPADIRLESTLAGGPVSDA